MYVHAQSASFLRYLSVRGLLLTREAQRSMFRYRSVLSGLLLRTHVKIAESECQNRSRSMLKFKGAMQKFKGAFLNEVTRDVVIFCPRFTHTSTPIRHDWHFSGRVTMFFPGFPPSRPFSCATKFMNEPFAKNLKVGPLNYIFVLFNLSVNSCQAFY